MDRALLFLLLGTGVGALYASLSLGLVLVHRGAGVVFLAHGAVTSYTAYTYSELRASGRIVIPPLPNPLALGAALTNRWLGTEWSAPRWPTFLSFGEPLGTPAALTVALTVAAVLGLLLHVLVFRPLRGAPPLAKIVAAVGVMVTLQSIIGLRFGSNGRTVMSILPSDPVDVGVGTVPADRFWLVGIVAVVTLALHQVYRRTRFGLASRAAAENERGALLLGWAPDRLAAIGWVLASVLAGLLGILVAPVTSLTPTNFTLFVIPALAAALCGRLESFPLAAAAGLALGMVDQLLVYLDAQPAFDWLPRGSREALPFLTIAVVLAATGRRLPVRGEAATGHLPSAPAPWLRGWRVVVLAAPAVAGVLLLEYDWRQAITTSLIGAVMALSVVILTGFVGQISLAQMSIAGASAFALTRLTGEWHIAFPVGMVVAAAVGAALGVLVGLPALRVRGVHLAAVTLGLAWALDEMLFNNPDVIGDIGSQTRAPSPALFGMRFGPLDAFRFGDGDTPTEGFGLFVLLVTVLMVLAVSNLRRSATGRRLLAVRANERASAAIGIDVVTTKLTAFWLSAFLAGTAGSLLAYQASGAVSSTGFSVFTSLTVVAIAYLAGIASVGGAVLAGALATGGVIFLAFDRLLAIEAWEQMAAGLGLVVAAVAHPSGMVGAFGGLWRRFRTSERATTRAELAVDEAVA